MVLHKKICLQVVRRRTASLLFVALLVAPGSVAADSYAVNAVVPYPAPTVAAVIDPSLDGTTVGQALQTISGSCELMNPSGVVSILDNGVASGSTVCNGTFSLQILLHEGSNSIVARTANASEIYGPDSQITAITLNLPTVLPPPVQTTDTTPSTSTAPVTPDSPQATNSNAAVGSGLMLITTTPFSVLPSDSKVVTITILVGGGTNPYSIMLNWGDGSTESHSVAEAGSYQFSHTFREAKAYIVHGQVRDVLGATTEFSYAVVTTVKDSTSDSTSHSQGGGNQKMNDKYLRAIVPGAIIGGIIAVIGYGYWLGWQRAKAHFAKLADNTYRAHGSRRTPKKGLQKKPIIKKAKR